jgi:uncharacterized protein
MLTILILMFVVGITLGLLGGGGSILAVPVLVYAAGLSAKAAIATSLAVVGTTALFALIPHARRGSVNWQIGAVFSITAMTGAYFGGIAANWFSGRILLLIFAGMMLVASLAMLRGATRLQPNVNRPIAFKLIIIEGLVVGVATGLVGAGGGFLIVPALVLLASIPMHTAIGTSLIVIALKSFAALAGHITHVDIDFQLTLAVTVAAICGSFVGALLANKVPAKILRKTFAGFVMVMAVYISWKEAGPLPALGFGLAASVGVGILLWSNSSTTLQPQ